MSVRNGVGLRLAVITLLMATPAIAQSTPPSVATVGFPATLPWLALKSNANGNTFGYPDAGPWPVSLSIGDIDHDGRIDYLLCMEQRLLVAFGFNVNAKGVPISPYVIWAWFDPTGNIYKHGWSKDSACIHDFDGDGLAEVAAVVGKDPFAPGNLANSFRVVILGGATTQDPAFGNVPRPQILATQYLDAINPGWTNQMIGQGGATLSIQAFDDDTSSDGAHELFVHDTGKGYYGILSYQPGSGGSPGSFLTLYNHGIYQPLGVIRASTHSPQAYDLDGDGLDELLYNGYVDLQSACGFDLWSLPTFATCSNQNNHADFMQPLDRDQDGDFELVVAHDCHDFILDGSPTLCTPLMGAVNSLPIAGHGQELCVGRFLPQADIFGYDGRDYLATPKGCPIWNGTSTWGSYTMNGAGDRLAANRSTAASPTGPNGWGTTNFDWDGDRSSDEVLSVLGIRVSVWKLVQVPAQGPTHNSCLYSPTLLDYSWSEVSTFNEIVWSQYTSFTADIFGDYREEIIVIGRNGAQFASCQTAVPAVPRHLSPRLSLEYQRREAGSLQRTIDYQRLPTLKNIEVRPTTIAPALGASVNYTAIGHYVGADGTDIEVDLTAHAKFSSGDSTIASFTGNVLTTHALGLVVLNADVEGLPMVEVPMAMVTNLENSHVLYAGWKDTHLTGASSSELMAEVRIADGDANTTGATVTPLGGSQIVGPNPINDSGLSGDAIAGDGLWTLTVPGFAVGAPHDDYVSVMPVEPLPTLPYGTYAPEWPYLRVGNGSVVVPSGLQVPWESELYSAGPWPKLRATGIWPQNLPSGGSTRLRVFARVDDPLVTSIAVYFRGVLVNANMNDNGTQSDDFAGDGLWTGGFTVVPAPDGKYVIDFVAGSATNQSSDAYPRLRHHN